jgi:hypothetical protein
LADVSATQDFQARATLTDLVEQIKADDEKFITKIGESYVAIIDSWRLDYFHPLERERIPLLLVARATFDPWQLSTSSNSPILSIRTLNASAATAGLFLNGPPARWRLVAKSTD